MDVPGSTFKGPGAAAEQSYQAGLSQILTSPFHSFKDRLDMKMGIQGFTKSLTSNP